MQNLKGCSATQTDWHNPLLQKHLENNPGIGEEGPSVKDFDPEKAIDWWYNQKMWRVSAAKRHSYPDKRRKLGQSSTWVHIVTNCASDFKMDSDNDERSMKLHLELLKVPLCLFMFSINNIVMI